MHCTATHKGVALLIFRIVFYREGGSLNTYFHLLKHIKQPQLNILFLQ